MRAADVVETTLDDVSVREHDRLSVSDPVQFVGGEGTSRRR